MLSIAVVEDEELYREQLKSFLKRYESEKAVSVSAVFFEDGVEIVENYSGQFDIILMDIQMQHMDGMTAAEAIRKMDQTVVIIFITNMVQYAVKGYQVDALDYIVKPVEYFSFSQKLDRAVSRLRKNETHFIPVSSDGGIYKLVTSRILYIESQGHTLHFYTSDGEITSRMNISEAEEILSPYGFYRCGKGYLINLEKVSSYSDGICTIEEHRIPVSRSKKKDFLNVMTEYMRSRLT